MGDHEVRAWLGAALIGGAGFSKGEAESVIAGVLADQKWATPCSLTPFLSLALAVNEIFA